jgi:hypothetical protein
MKQINFLPADLHARELKHRTAAFLVVAFVVAVVAVVVPWLMVRSVGQDLRQQVTRREEQLALQPTAEDAAGQLEQQRKVDDLIARTKALNDLAKQEVDWSKAFILVSSAVPQDVLLTTYTLTNTANTFTIKMVGTAPSNLSFASFVESLQGNERFTKVVVDGFTYSPEKGNVTFSVTLTAKTSQILFQVPKS